MSEDAAPQCEYCNLYGHPQDDCPTRKSDQRWDRAGAWTFFVLLLPFAFVGMLAGWIAGALRAGYAFSIGGWESTWKMLFSRSKQKKEGA